VAARIIIIITTTTAATSCAWVDDGRGQNH
jgi:hypothetical protein